MSSFDSLEEELWPTLILSYKFKVIGLDACLILLRNFTNYILL
jgi:hypothetical protein